MSYCDVVCAGCHGEMACVDCDEQYKRVACPNCQAEVQVVDRVARETWDPEAVRRLVDCILDNSFGLPRRLIADAQAIRESEKQT